MGVEGVDPASTAAAAPLAWRDGVLQPARRALPVEVAVAITYDGSTQAVLMASPGDLEDFAIGFSLTEGIVASPSDILSIERIDAALGIEMRMRLAEPRAARLAARRRAMAGPVGCGLCGIESLEEAARQPARVASGGTFAPEAILAAMADLDPRQRLNAATHAVHAAAFWRADAGILALREDIGRHNALDKLAGALARRQWTGAGGAVLLTSRVSVEMVQKTAAIGAPLLVAVSAPSDLAVRMAEAAGLTLVAIARADGFEIFTHSERFMDIQKEPSRDVA